MHQRRAKSSSSRVGSSVGEAYVTSERTDLAAAAYIIHESLTALLAGDNLIVFDITDSRTCVAVSRERRAGHK